MNLYLLRHGIAEERRAGLSDERRTLTARGSRRVRKIARAMKCLDLKIERILASPSTRAKRTAAIVADTLGGPVLLIDELRPEGNPREVIAAVRARRERNILLVGHEPLMSQLVSVLVTGTPAADITIRKGGLCKLRVTRLRFGKCAQLEWLLAPRQAVRLR
jgi:phosphohistidine phosphatase